ILAPVFWAPDMVRDPARLWRLLGILLVCNGVNASVGILQVYDPDRWLPKEYSSIVMDTYGEALTFTGADGRQMVRPPGLSDSPGAVCGPAAAAALLGLIFCVQPGLALWRRGGAAACAFAGIAAIYLSNVRSSLIVVLGSALAFVVVLYIQKERRRASMLLALAAGLVIGGLAFATALGGQGIFERFATLLEDDPRTVYYKNRGNQVHYAFDYYLAEYPLGAGLGRWGMMRHYFGNEDNPRSPMIWAEIQFPAFILDGGIVLLVVYTLAVARSAWNEFQIARKSTNPQLRGAAAAVFATNLGTIALMFSYVPFVAPIGVQFWFLAGCLHGATRADKSLQPKAPAGMLARRSTPMLSRRRRSIGAAV
ncbi:MAG TPA: O-antigen ligase family protein, partial [Tepidisphaeraceae bacterium]|nr:O-antigen ligase family protein [Tepidisphaeraceae bacterium]